MELAEGLACVFYYMHTGRSSSCMGMRRAHRTVALQSAYGDTRHDLVRVRDTLRCYMMTYA